MVESAGFIKALGKNKTHTQKHTRSPANKNATTLFSHPPLSACSADTLTSKKVFSGILEGWTVARLRIFDVHEVLFGWCRPSVPGTRVVAPLDAGEVLGLLSVHGFLHHPVCPQALRGAADQARDGGAASDLRTRETHQ